MTVKVSVKGRFVYNGKAYGSLEELPENVREAYEKAMAGSASGVPGSAPAATLKIVFNGTEYESLDAMPADQRRLYEDAIAAVRAGHFLGAGGSTLQGGRGAEQGAGTVPSSPITAAPIEPGGAKSRPSPVALALGLVLLLMLLGFYLYMSAVPK